MGLPHVDKKTARTFRRVALNKGSKGCRPTFKPPIISNQAEARLEFANQHESKNMRYWSRIIFTDETVMSFRPVDRRERVRRPRHKRFDRRFVLVKPKPYGDTQKFWGLSITEELEP